MDQQLLKVANYDSQGSSSFLKDNDITALPVNDNALQQLMESMPFPSDEDISKGKTSLTN